MDSVVVFALAQENYSKMRIQNLQYPTETAPESVPFTVQPDPRIHFAQLLKIDFSEKIETLKLTATAFHIDESFKLEIDEDSDVWLKIDDEEVDYIPKADKTMNSIMGNLLVQIFGDEGVEVENLSFPDDNAPMFLPDSGLQLHVENLKLPYLQFTAPSDTVGKILSPKCLPLESVEIQNELFLDDDLIHTARKLIIRNVSFENVACFKTLRIHNFSTIECASRCFRLIDLWKMMNAPIGKHYSVNIGTHVRDMYKNLAESHLRSRRKLTNRLSKEFPFYTIIPMNDQKQICLYVKKQVDKFRALPVEKPKDITWMVHVRVQPFEPEVPERRNQARKSKKTNRK